jgi:hypothetical protein
VWNNLVISLSQDLVLPEEMSKFQVSEMEKAMKRGRTRSYMLCSNRYRAEPDLDVPSVVNLPDDQILCSFDTRLAKHVRGRRIANQSYGPNFLRAREQLVNRVHIDHDHRISAAPQFSDQMQILLIETTYHDMIASPA